MNDVLQVNRSEASSDRSELRSGRTCFEIKCKKDTFKYNFDNHLYASKYRNFLYFIIDLMNNDKEKIYRLLKLSSFFYNN